MMLKRTPLTLAVLLCTVVVQARSPDATRPIWSAIEDELRKLDQAAIQPRADLALLSGSSKTMLDLGRAPATQLLTDERSSKILRRDFFSTPAPPGLSHVESTSKLLPRDFEHVSRRLSHMPPSPLKAENLYLHLGEKPGKLQPLPVESNRSRMLQATAGEVACEEEKLRLEALSEYDDFDCTCVLTELGSTRLRCVQGECGEYCNDEGSVCGKEQMVRLFDRDGPMEIIGDAFQYTRGRSQFMVLERYDCTIDDRGREICSEECSFVVNSNRPCNLCTMQDCGGGRQAPLLDCENFGSGQTYDLCEYYIDVPDGLFEYLSTEEFNECVDPLAAAKEACSSDAQFFESMVDDRQYMCRCEENSLDAVTLSCTDVCGEYCNADDSVCGIHVYDQVYRVSGQADLVAEHFHYTEGRNERVTLVKRDCVADQADEDPSSFICDACTMYVDLNRQCRTCHMQTCMEDDGTSFQAPFLDCGNLVTGAVFDLCDRTSLEADATMFDFLRSDLFSVCVDSSPENDRCHENLETIPTDGTVIVASTENAFIDHAKPCGGFSNSPGLWYRVEGTGSGLMASTGGPETNFDTILTLYSGSCESLECVDFNDDLQDAPPGHSSVEWFAESGQVYFIRVHGYDNLVGEFALKVEASDLALKECVATSSIFEGLASPISGTSCSCDSIQGSESQSMRCTDSCNYCNDDRSVCATKTVGGVFDETSAMHTNTLTVQYVAGRRDTIVSEESSCTATNGCGECAVSIDTRQCRSCEYVDCYDISGSVRGRGKEVDCSNVENGGYYSTCDDDISFLEGTLLEAVFGGIFKRCRREPLGVCESVAVRQEENGANGLVCGCDGDDESATISCRETECTYCNTETTVCANVTAGRVFTGDVGETTMTFREYQYVEGRSDSLRLEEANDSCRATVNGAECSCEYIICRDRFGDYEGLEINCTNIEDLPDTVHNNCNPRAVIEEGLFEVFSDSEFDKCLATSDPVAECQRLKEREEKKGNIEDEGTECSCTENTETGGQTLTCSNNDCVYCNYDATVCATNTFGLHIGRFAQVVSSYIGYQYVEGGRSELVVYEFLGGDCSVTVNGTQCDSCAPKKCEDENLDVDSGGVEIQCQNVGGAAFDTCSDIFVDSGPLEVFSHSEFNTCIKPSTSSAACLEELNSTDTDYAVECTCSENDLGGHTKHCVEKDCLYCNSERTVCGYQTFGTKYGRLGQNIGAYNGFQYIEGREELVLLEPVLTPGDERECVVSVHNDGEVSQCESCEILDCGLFLGLDVKCDNLAGGGNFNECAFSAVETGLMEFASPVEFDECIEERDPADVCAERKQVLEATKAEEGTVCQCSESESGVTLSCANTACEFCNEEGEVCEVDVAYGGLIGEFGFFVSNFQTFAYTRGRSERILLEQTRADNACAFTVDGEQCSSCEVVECADNSLRFDIVCEGIEPGAIYKGCGELGEGFFEVLSDSSFDQCLPYDGTFPPTSSPEFDQADHGGPTGEGVPTAESDAADTRLAFGRNVTGFIWLGVAMLLGWPILV